MPRRSKPKNQKRDWRWYASFALNAAVAASMVLGTVLLFSGARPTQAVPTIVPPTEVPGSGLPSVAPTATPASAPTAPEPTSTPKPVTYNESSIQRAVTNSIAAAGYPDGGDFVVPVNAL